MTCDQCGAKLVNVGREIMPGHPEVWTDGWVCKMPRCPGYAKTRDDGSLSRWPALTLMGIGVDLKITGAMKFRDAT